MWVYGLIHKLQMTFLKSKERCQDKSLILSYVNILPLVSIFKWACLPLTITRSFRRTYLQYWNVYNSLFLA